MRCLPHSYLHFYPRPPRGGRLTIFTERDDKVAISIHALREEGDTDNKAVFFKAFRISIHALREEGDVDGDSRTAQILRFLSTPSARRATICHQRCSPSCFHFYPRPPRGGRPNAFCHADTRGTFLSTPSARRATSKASPSLFLMVYFYPRPPRGGRQNLPLTDPGIFRFLSTPSARRATKNILKTS